mmetsp:Transcript_28690/g.63170  ORF Transcript_28690/g.63170 Transcript_28690/m.63170 type:complete len:181 (-) Transcript_28690:1763-2305(-)
MPLSTASSCASSEERSSCHSAVSCRGSLCLDVTTIEKAQTLLKSAFDDLDQAMQLYLGYGSRFAQARAACARSRPAGPSGRDLVVYGKRGTADRMLQRAEFTIEQAQCLSPLLHDVVATPLLMKPPSYTSRVLAGVTGQQPVDRLQVRSSGYGLNKPSAPAVSQLYPVHAWAIPMMPSWS